MTVLVRQRKYTPRGAAKDVFSRRNGEVLIAGAAGTGKSRACLEKLHMMSLLNGNMRSLMVRKTHVSLTGTGLVTFREHVAKEAIETGLIHWYGGSSEKPPAYIYPNGSTIAVGGMDKPMKVMSSEYDLVYVQEATELTLEDWEAISSRLRNGRVSFQQILADCNPDAPTHWLNKRCDEGKTLMLYGKHEDNPTLYNEDGSLTQHGAAYMERLDNLTGVRLQRLRYGKWVAAEGIIYEEYDPQLHLLNPDFEIPYSWRRVWTVDFGYTNPFVLQCWAIDEDGRGYLYREIYKTKTMVEDHAKKILSCVLDNAGRWKEPKPSAIICDHDAEDRATLERHLGISTTAAHKAVSTGLEATKKRFRVAGDGRPRLYLLRDALVERDNELVQAGKPTCTADEIPGYVWEPPALGRPPKENPLKKDDHGCDAKRYFVASQDLVGVPNIRVLG
jgi:PBSX family phage terminase large subunit